MQKPFTLFCGPNSTGKTYLSYILYAIHKDFGYTGPRVSTSLVQSLFENQEISLSQENIEQYLSSYAKYIKVHLGSVFGIGDEAVKTLFADFDLKLSLQDGEFTDLMKQSHKRTTQIKDMVILLSKKAKSSIVTYSIEGDTKGKKNEVVSSLGFLLTHLMRRLCQNYLGGSRMLTVERNSIYTFKTELSLTRNELIERIQQQAEGKELNILNIVNKNSRRYPLAISDSLRIANDLENVQKFTSPYCGIAQQIEGGILHGEVNITEHGEVEFIPSNIDGAKPLPIHLSSSIVKTMSSLVIYLKHIANKGDVLIIDEPELNFHPDAQIYLMRIFASLINNGLHLIVSTHSDYVVREVNNLIMAHEIRDEEPQLISSDLGYMEDMLLNKDDVVVKYLQYKDDESIVDVEDVTIYDDGFSVESMDKAIVRQNEITETLYYKLTKEV